MSITTIQMMVSWVDDNITEEPSLQRLSEYVGYSPFYCSVKFREYMQVTLKQYIANRKLEKAAVDILSVKANILDIALAYGFSSHAAFTRAFTRYFGLSPSQYRKKYGKGCKDEKIRQE